METKDLVWEHIQHNEYEEGCSECYSENRLIKAHRLCNQKSLLQKLKDAVDLDPMSLLGK